MGKAYPLLIETPNVSESNKQGIGKKVQLVHILVNPPIFTIAAYFNFSLSTDFAVCHKYYYVSFSFISQYFLVSHVISF